jgi:hypothetical protein
MARADRIRNGTGAEGIERMEASFHGQPFAPHRQRGRDRADVVDPTEHAAHASRPGEAHS